MRRGRIRAEGEGYYHCISRVVGGAHLMEGEREREVFRRMLGEVAAFSGVRVLTFVVMSNHFHLLVSVPERRPLDDVELVARYRHLYGLRRSEFMPSPEQLGDLLRSGPVAAAAQWRARLQARMFDVSAFMKTLKQRYSVWYNRSHDRFGALWAERFRSLVVEGSARALTTVAAYIDLNPVRAGMVTDPVDYRWSGYAEAMAGAPSAQEGIEELFAGAIESGSGAWATAATAYRRLLLGARGMPSTRTGPATVADQGGSSTAGEPALSEILRRRVRYFRDGAVLGSEVFVESWIERLGLSKSRGKGRKPKPMAGANWDDLTVLRGLRSRLFE